MHFYIAKLHFFTMDYYPKFLSFFNVCIIIVDAAKRAGIAEFIHTLPDGYDTDMGQMSARLSGGERQRIGIARILLRNPDICLMDEPSSALDALHEKELLHTLQTAYAGKTLLLISHRGSTLTGCSRILRAEDLK